MTDDTKFVLKHEHERDKGKIYERFNHNEIKYNEKFSELNNKIERQTDLQQRMLDSQERQEKNGEKLNTTMEKIGSEFLDIKYKVQSHDEKLSIVQGVINEKEKGNAQIIGIILTGIFGVISAAIGAAKIFF